MKNFGTIAMLLLVIGGLNWGLVALFQFNLVTALFGEVSMLSTLVYVFVAVSALYVGYKTLTKPAK